MIVERLQLPKSFEIRFCEELPAVPGERIGLRRDPAFFQPGVEPLLIEFRHAWSAERDVGQRIFVDHADRDDRRFILPGESGIGVDVIKQIRGELLIVFHRRVADEDQRLVLFQRGSPIGIFREFSRGDLAHGEEVDRRVDSAFFQGAEQVIHAVEAIGVGRGAVSPGSLDQLPVEMVETDQIVSRACAEFREFVCFFLLHEMDVIGDIGTVETGGDAGTFFKFRPSVHAAQTPVFSRGSVEEVGEVENASGFDVLAVFEFHPVGIRLHDQRNVERGIHLAVGEGDGRNEPFGGAVAFKRDPLHRLSGELKARDIKADSGARIDSPPADRRVFDLARHPEVGGVDAADNLEVSFASGYEPGIVVFTGDGADFDLVQRLPAECAQNVNLNP